MTQFSLPISTSNCIAAHFLIGSDAVFAADFWIGSDAKKLINLRSWEGGVKPVLDKPKQG